MNITHLLGSLLLLLSRHSCRGLILLFVGLENIESGDVKILYIHYVLLQQINIDCGTPFREGGGTFSPHLLLLLGLPVLPPLASLLDLGPTGVRLKY